MMISCFTSRLVAVAAVVVSAFGMLSCDAARPPVASAAAPDSTYAIQPQLQHFRDASGPAPAQFDGPTSRDALVEQVVAALRRGDRTALERLTLTRGEFAWLYYEDNPLAKPPYELDPDLMWYQVRARSDRGLFRALREYAGRLDAHGYTCEAQPMRSGALTIWNRCVVRHVVDGHVIAEPLFGSVVERAGRYKLVGFSNRL